MDDTWRDFARKHQEQAARSYEAARILHSERMNWQAQNRAKMYQMRAASLSNLARHALENVIKERAR